VSYNVLQLEVVEFLKLFSSKNYAKARVLEINRSISSDGWASSCCECCKFLIIFEAKALVGVFVSWNSGRSI
jgi:hypothetical protein